MKRRVIMPSWCWTICKMIILRESDFGMGRIAADPSYRIPSVFKIRIGCNGKFYNKLHLKYCVGLRKLGLVLHNKLPSHLYPVILMLLSLSRLLLSPPTKDKTVISPRQSWRGAGLPPEQKSPWHPSRWQWVPWAFEPTPSAILLLGCNTSFELSSDLVQASTLYCQGDKTNPRNVCSSWWGSKAAGFGQPTSQTRYCYGAPFPFVVLEGGSSCDEG